MGRSHELRHDFKSFHTRDGEARYYAILQAMKQGRILPPVELYKLHDRYYVVDGNHRVAAARSLGQVEIDAVVTEFQPVPGHRKLQPAVWSGVFAGVGRSLRGRLVWRKGPLHSGQRPETEGPAYLCPRL